MNDTPKDRLLRFINAQGGKNAVAKKAGISRNTLNSVLNGKDNHKSTVDKLLKALGADWRMEEGKPDPRGNRERVVLPLSQTARLNLELVANRYNVHSLTVLEAAPALFALMAERSLAERSDHLAEVERLVTEVRSSAIAHRLLEVDYGVLRTDSALWEEHSSIDKRDLDARHDGYSEEVGDVTSPFVVLVKRELEAVGIEARDIHGSSDSESFFRHAEVFADDLTAITINDPRALFALRERHSTIAAIPKELRWEKHEAEEKAHQRRDWLARHVPDEAWAEHEAKQASIADLLKDL